MSPTTVDATRHNTTTIAGNVPTNSYVWMSDMIMPEFDRSKTVTADIKAYIFDAPCKYDLIIGREFLKPLGIDVAFKKCEVKWTLNEQEEPMTIPMKPANIWEDPISAMALLLDEDEYEQYLSSMVAEIKPSDYHEVNVDEVAKLQLHLTAAQQEELKKILLKHIKLFDGKLGTYPHRKFHIDLKPDATPVRRPPYSVAQAHREVFRQEIQRLVDIGILEPVYEGSEWALPTFCIPKKNHTIRIISDLRALNECIRRKPYPLPHIMDILRKRPRYEFFTKLDISMQYYTFELDDESAELCTIIADGRLYRYRKAPMGLCCSPDWAQSIMDKLFKDMEEADCYLDDCGIFSNSLGRPS